MGTQRRELYARLRESASNTPLFRLEGIEIPNNCKVFVKAEYLNPSGSHYDREMVRLLEWLELDARLIAPGETRMLETTTGNSGSAFAWLCRALDYPPPVIIIPADMPRARRAQIAAFGAELVESPPGEYITGIEATFGAMYGPRGEKAKADGLYCPMHWEDDKHGVEAMRECGVEILRDVKDLGVDLDYFMFALGNGSSARGIGEALRPEKVTLLGMEPLESPVVAESLGWATFHLPEHERRHGIIGTGPAVPRQIYKNMQAAKEMLSAIEHVSTDECREMQRELMDRAFRHVGMSSAGCVVAIRKFIERENVRNRSFGTVFYDPAWKYLD